MKKLVLLGVILLGACALGEPPSDQLPSVTGNGPNGTIMLPGVWSLPPPGDVIETPRGEVSIEV